ncbi:MAG: UbiA family prenyltransferase [Candidatus Omnitrophica bacterium]|nr:UbiA family prenyltransferase [Candidatus Omnitrophota bacterium]HOX53830.1 UbiA family prenyltransferase [Candidatus Omnitrophota bacterium]
MKILHRIGNFLENIENPKIPLLYYFLTLFASIITENFLEIFSDPGFVPFRLFPFVDQRAVLASTSIAIHFLHCSLWWMAVVLIFPLVFSLVTKEDINKTLRAMLSFSWVMLITPLTDILVSGGQGLNIHYAPLKKLSDILYLPQELTIGENLTAVVILALAFSYCFIKTKKIAKATAGIVLISLAIGMAFLIPSLARILAGILKINLEAITPIPVSRVLTLVIVAELSLAFYLSNKRYFQSLAKDMNLFKTLNFILIFILGILLFRDRADRFILENMGSFLLSAVAITLVWAQANVLSRLTSEEDPIHKKAALGILILSLLCAMAVNFTTLLFILLGSGLCVVYLLPPWRLKILPLISKLVVSFAMIILLMLGWLFAGGEIFAFPQVFSMYLLVFFSISLSFVDIKDYAQDKASSFETVPVTLGEKHAKFIIGVSFLVSYLAIPWLFLNKMLFFPFLALGLVQFYLINRKNFREEPVFAVYLSSLICLLVWMNSFRFLN